MGRDWWGSSSVRECLTQGILHSMWMLSHCRVYWSGKPVQPLPLAKWRHCLTRSAVGLGSVHVQTHKGRLDNRFWRGSVGRYQKILKMNFHSHHAEVEDFGVISRLCSILGFNPHWRSRFALGAYSLLAWWWELFCRHTLLPQPCYLWYLRPTELHSKKHLSLRAGGEFSVY